MCKAEELWKQIDAYRRCKMTQDEIDSALMEYITSLEKQLNSLLSSVDKLKKVKGRYHTEQSYNELIEMSDKIKEGLTNGQRK